MSTRRPHPEHGILVLADISGFTAYLAGVELEHAHEIIRELLEFIVGRLRPLLTLAQIEGDAVFAYTPEPDQASGETLLALIETTYVAFKTRLIDIHRRITCTCKACREVTSLDLKFLVHYGEYLSQRIYDQPELLGLAPLFVREREWKGPVREATGWRGYLLLTEAGLARLGLRPETLRELSGPDQMRLYGLDLLARYQAWLEARRVVVAPQDAHATLTLDLPAPPPVVWDWLNDPDRRNRWATGMRWSAGARPGGRLGPGASSHCVHGSGTATETILDWRPFDYFTVELRAWPGPLAAIQTVRLEPTSAGGATRLHFAGRFQGRLPGWLARRLGGLLIGRVLKPQFANLARLLAVEQTPSAGPGP